MIIKLEENGKFTSKFTMHINFVSSKDSEEIRTTHTKSHNIENMMGNKTDEITEKNFESLLQNYQKDLEESMKGSEFVLDNIDLLYYHLQKIGLKRGRSYKDSPEWLKNEKATINPKNNDNNCFQYALTVALNCQHIEKKPQRISKNKPFIDQYNWKKYIFHHTQKTGKSLNKTIRRLLLICYFYHTILK